jgi:hypothetical protein
MGLDRLGSPPGRPVFAAVTGRWLPGLAGAHCRAARAGPPRAGGRSLAAGTSALMWAPHQVIRGSPVSRPSRRAWGKVTAWVFFRQRDHRHGRAPWPGPHRGPAGRAGGPPASGARAGPSAGGYGSAALCLISSAGHSIPWGPVAGSPALVAWLFGKRYGFPPAWGVTRRCMPGGISRRGDLSPEGATGPAGVRCQGIRPSCRARSAASVRLAGPIMCAHRSR